MTGRLLTSLTALTMIGGAVAQLAGCTSRQDLGDPPSLGPDTDAGAAGDAAGASGAPPLRGFVTAASFSGDLVGAAGGTGSGLAAADLICQTAADGAELHGLFVAYLASGSIDALDRIVDDGPFYAVDGKARLYANKAAVGAGASEEISDENGKPVKDYYSGADKFGNPVAGSTAASFWTGATPIGKASGADCGGWMLTDDLSEDGAHASYLGASQVLLGCSTERHLLCLEQRSAPITPVTKRVFITSQEFTGAFVSPGSATSPLVAADARCNASAREG
ncbi:MAG TPA: hypothetical protein VM925_19875, partial [Labilithrix sp.]|nr:hypothetical protein [Labilithrix sp.]